MFFDGKNLCYLKVNEQETKIKETEKKQTTKKYPQATTLVLDCPWSAILCAKLESRGNLKPSYINFIMEMLSNA